MSGSVSILIPCCNAAPYLAAAVHSALSQTWFEKEVILVDDGSSDCSLDIARTFQTRGLQIVLQSNRGAAAARNVALDCASGDYIQFLDADDILGPDKIEQQMALLHRSEPGTVASCAWGVFAKRCEDAEFHPEPIWADFSPVDWLVCSWSGGGMMQPGAWLTPRTVLDAAGPWDEELSLDDDGEYFTRVLLSCRSVRFCPGARTYYRKHSGPRLSASRQAASRLSSFNACVLKTRFLLMQENSSRTREACATNFQRFIYDNYPEARELVTQAERSVTSLGGSDLRLSGGLPLRLLAALFGWRFAKRLQRVLKAQTEASG